MGQWPGLKGPGPFKTHQGLSPAASFTPMEPQWTVFSRLQPLSQEREGARERERWGRGRRRGRGERGSFCLYTSAHVGVEVGGRTAFQQPM